MNAIPEYVAFIYYAGIASTFISITAIATIYIERRLD